MRAKDKLRATWSKTRTLNDVLLHFPVGIGTNNDAHWLAGVFCKEFTDELESRGYDVTTMKFEVSPAAGDPKFASQRQTSKLE
jgi:hypothetical protein